MNIPSILGFIGTLIGLVRAVPQLIRLLRARGAFGVSVDTAATSSIVSLGWAVYGLLTNQTFVLLATGSSGLIFAMITFMVLRYGRSLRELRVAPVWLVVLVVSGFSFGTNVLGILLALSALVSNIPQIRVAYREDNLSGLSLGTWVLSLSDGLVWGTYAVLQQDVSIMASGAFQTITSALVVGRILYQHLNRNPDKNDMHSRSIK